MFPSPAELQLYARASARRGAVVLAGAVLAAIGGGFLLAAVWIVLAQAFNALAANLVIAALLLGPGLVLMLRPPPRPVLPGPAERLRAAGASGRAFQPTGSLPPLAEAFLFGVSVALQTRAARR